MLLALDTTSAPGSLALLDDAGTCASVTGDGRPHGARLPAAVLDLLASRGRVMADVDVFAVATGPGSLTGLRVGMATVQGLAFAAGRRCVGVSVFEALAWAWLRQAPAVGDLFGVWLDARRDEVFTSLVRRTAAGLAAPATLGDLVTVVDDPSVGSATACVGRWKALVGPGQRGWCCGSRVDADRALIAGIGIPFAVMDVPARLAVDVAEVAAREVGRGRTVAPHALHPLYVRRPDAELVRERARAAQAP